MMPGGAGSPLQQLIAQFGSSVIVTDPTQLAAVNVDHRKLYEGKALALALPRNTAEVSKLLAFCNVWRIGVVPQGGNTSYCGGTAPDASGTQLVLSLRRMNTIREMSKRVAFWRTCNGPRRMPDVSSRSVSAPRAAARSAATSRPMRAA
jgi:FAD/FMN-containing dehydrogenase